MEEFYKFLLRYELLIRHPAAMGVSQQHFAFLLGIDRGMLSMAEIGSRSLPSVHQIGLPYWK